MRSCRHFHLLHPTAAARCNINTMWSNITIWNGPIITMHDFFSSMPYHAVFGFLNPLLLAFLQVSVQGRTKSLLDTHPKNMWTFVLATFIYCFSFAAEMKFRFHHPSYSQLFGTIAITSGSISAASLVSIIIPCSAQHKILIGSTLLPIIIVVGCRHAILLKDVYNWISQKICVVRGMLKGIHPTEEAQLLPVQI